MDSNKEWRVFPHGSVQKISENILRVESPLIKGPPLKRVMTIVRMSDGGLVIHSAIALDEQAMKTIEEFGEPKYLVVPNHWHRIDAARYLQRYPQMKVFCPAGCRHQVEEKVPVHGVYEEFPQDMQVRIETLSGVGRMEGVIVVEEKEGTTLVFNDIIFNMPHLSGFQGFLLRYVMCSSGGPRISRLSRWFLIKDKKALQQHLTKLALLPRLQRIIVSHHEMITSNPAQVLQKILET